MSRRRKTSGTTKNTAQVNQEQVKESTTSHPVKAVTGKINKEKILEANKVKQAAVGGMGFGWNTFSGSGMNTGYLNNSYANMGQSTTAFGDVPLYFALMNQQNGGILYWPVTIKQKYSWYRYFVKADPMVKSAVRLHSDLPMSKLVLRMPKMENKQLRKKILYKYENMVKKINLFQKLHSVLFETNVLGNAYAFIEFNEESKEWQKIVILPPEEITVSKLPMSNESKIQYSPEILSSLLKRFSISIASQIEYDNWIQTLNPEQKQVVENVPYEFAKQLVENDGKLIMDTSPYCGDEEHKIGSFVYHFYDKKHEYEDIGVSPLECVLVPLLMKEHYKYTQLSLASRNMTPRNKISAPGISEEALDQLREQIDMSMLNPDYSIVTNYDWQWEQIGAENRLIDLGREYENINEQLFAGLGVTKELLTGEGMYSGSKISIEILNTRYLLVREMLQRFVEDSLFLPMAKENDFYELDEYGNKHWIYPRLSFSRLTIRDNSEVFDSLFQLYQKGSLPISYLYEVFNLDEDEINEKLKSDMFTVKDATYNDLIRGIYSDLSQKITEETDLVDQIINTMIGPEGKKLTKKEPPQEQGGYDDSYGDDSSYGDYEDNPQEQTSDLVDEMEVSNSDINTEENTTQQQTTPMSLDALLDSFEKQQNAQEENKNE